MLETRFDPPYDIKGKGIPATGTIPISIPKLNAIYTKNIAKMPEQRRYPNKSLELRAIKTIRHNIKIYKPKTSKVPMRPFSSPKIAKIKSVCLVSVYMYMYIYVYMLQMCDVFLLLDGIT